MSAIRRLAQSILRAAVRRSAVESEEWALAMLAEMEFIDSDWAALWWAMGCCTAICRQSGHCILKRFRKQAAHKEAGMNDGGKKALGFVSGIGLALGVTAVALGLLFGAFSLFPSIEAHQMGQWFHLGIGVIIPETIFIVTTILLWRKRRPMAIGILLFAAATWVHLAIHFTHLWRG
jgi:hypothetical protein